MSARSWIKISGCAAMVVGLAGLVACTVTTTSPPGDAGATNPFPNGGGDGGGGGGMDGGGGRVDGGGGGGGDAANPGTCSLGEIKIASANCTACAQAMCCTQIVACLNEDQKCRTFAECIEGCNTDGGGTRNDAGFTPCEVGCGNAQTQDTLKKYDDWAANCVGMKCRTQCSN